MTPARRPGSGPRPGAQPSPRGGAQQPRQERPPQRDRQQPAPVSSQPAPPADGPREFLNPYNFLPTPPRPAPKTPLGDDTPPGHQHFAAGTYSGSIEITLTARTPLLLIDHAHATPATDSAAKRVGARRAGTTTAAGPLLNGSTVKGMLRSAFEAVTNSRYGIVSAAHDLPVAVRQDPREVNRKSLKPAIVVNTNADGNWVAMAVDYLDPTPYPFDDDTPMHPAPWVPTGLGPALVAELGLPGIEHLDNQPVEAWLHLQEHPAQGNRRSFGLWRVSDIAAPGKLGEPSQPLNPSWTVPGQEPVKVLARLHWTHSSFPAGGRKKHDERLVVIKVLDDGPAELIRTDPFVIPKRAARRFAGVIDSYRRAHATEQGLETKYGSYVWDPGRWKLDKGRTLYVEFAGQSLDVANLYPAVIGRDPFPLAPVELIDSDHAPATRYDRLSPADRVFGWVHPEAGEQPDADRNAHRSQLRVDPPACLDPTAGIKDLNGPVELGALNTPKTGQYRFYTDDDRGYRTGARLRGRKTFLPHRDTLGDSDYWTPRGGNKRTREYLAAQPGSKPKIKTAVTHWVPIGTRFRTTLWVHNLTDAELAALLWLLTLPEPAVYGIGLGKPLGFGAVTVTADPSATRLYDHDAITGRYRSLSAAAVTLTPEQVAALAAAFPGHSDAAGLTALRKQFLQAATGYTGLSVHYPRLGTATGAPSAPTETSYEWFVANTRQPRPHTLPPLTPGKAPTLPYLRPPEN